MEAASKVTPSKNTTKYRLIVILCGFIISVGLSFLVLMNLESVQEITLKFIPNNSTKETLQRLGDTPLSEYNEQISKKLNVTKKSLSDFLPNQPFIIINTSENRFKLFNDRRDLIREGLVSTGSFTVLRASNDKKWMFKTPRGQLKVLKKTKDPVWKRPDWAFIEDGLKIPSPNHPSRFEYGTLGDYSLSLGDGYLIHGTLYKRFLGLPVTHGCVRMGDEDLEVVFKTLQMGSKVYIY